LARRLRPQSDNLCYAGGVALNSVANERIVRESGFRSVYIMPAAEDSGTAFGAAYYGLWQLCGYQPTKEQRVDAFGCSYSNEEIGASIQRFPGVRTVKVPDVVERAVDLLADGKIVGWFQDGAEMGPRSLGQRSILCDPRRAEMKQMLNRKVKFREEFRPFAPMLPEEAVYDWFDVTPPHGISPFMLRVLDFREEQGSKVPAVVHVDGTGRVQTVSADASPTLHRLLTTFGRKTGVPILLNTSFNVAGEPIVETPADALWCFLHTGVDCCILGDHVVTKLEGVSAALDYPLQITADSVVLQGHVVNGSARFDIPTLRDADSHGYSAHLSRPEPMEGFRHTGKAPLSLRLVVTTDWGRVAHWVPGALIRILRLIDGRRTGREIYEELVADGSYAGDCSAGGTTISADSDSVVPSTRFHQHLGLLRRVGAIGFQSQPGRTDSRTRVQKVAVVSQEIAAPDTTYRSEEFLS
jgi:carbamoyltransferase